MYLFIFFFNDTATTEIYTLSLHDALPICKRQSAGTLDPRDDQLRQATGCRRPRRGGRGRHDNADPRSEEHTSELQSRLHLVCRLLLEKKKQTKNKTRVKNHKQKWKCNEYS